MFKTHSDYELKFPLPGELFGQKPTDQHWRAFEVIIQEFWFIVEYMIESDDVQYWKMICLSNLDDVLTLVASDFILDHRINLIVSVDQNNEQQIQSKLVVEIYSADENGHRSMRIYVASDGSRYIDTAIGYTENQAKNKSALYIKKDVNVKHVTKIELDNH